MSELVDDDAPIDRNNGHDGIDDAEQRWPSLAWRAFPFVRLTVLLALGAVLGAAVPLLGFKG